MLGLWQIHFRSPRKYLAGVQAPVQIGEAVTADVHRAARLIDTGLSSFKAFTPANVVVGPPR